MCSFKQAENKLTFLPSLTLFTFFNRLSQCPKITTLCQGGPRCPAFLLDQPRISSIYTRSLSRRPRAICGWPEIPEELINSTSHWVVASATANGDVCRIPVKATLELAVTHESDVGVSSPEQLRALGGIGPGLGAKWRKYRP